MCSAHKLLPLRSHTTHNSTNAIALKSRPHLTGKDGLIFGF
ncbi:hypothetical protein [Nostoc piscinale]|nr:hypothetical protein [Nostoc piscinale]